MNTTGIVKSALLLAASWCCNRTCTSPNPPADDSEQKKYSKEYKRSDSMAIPIKTMCLVYEVIFHILTFVELFSVVVTSLSPSTIAKLSWASQPWWLYLQSLQSNNVNLFAPTRLLGFALLAFGTWVRIACYSFLSRSYTFELSLKNDHRLITGGPYSWVRHPAYTGGTLFQIGGGLWILGSGSWWLERGASESLWWLGLGLFFFVWSSIFFVGIVTRTQVEDGVLKAHFKEDWVRWAKQTPYRLYPWIY